VNVSVKFIRIIQAKKRVTASVCHRETGNLLFTTIMCACVACEFLPHNGTLQLYHDGPKSYFKKIELISIITTERDCGIEEYSTDSVRRSHDSILNRSHCRENIQEGMEVSHR